MVFHTKILIAFNVLLILRFKWVNIVVEHHAKLLGEVLG